MLIVWYRLPYLALSTVLPYGNLSAANRQIRRHSTPESVSHAPRPPLFAPCSHEHSCLLVRFGPFLAAGEMTEDARYSAHPADVMSGYSTHKVLPNPIASRSTLALGWGGSLLTFCALGSVIVGDISCVYLARELRPCVDVGSVAGGRGHLGSGYPSLHLDVL